MTRTDKRRGPRPATTARRQEILKAASEVFGTKGYSSGSLGDIAERVGMTHAGILHHFGSKENLLLETLNYRDKQDLEHLADQSIPDGEELFRHLVHTALNNQQRPGLVQAFVVQSAESVAKDHPTRDHYRSRYESLRRWVERAFMSMCSEHSVQDAARIRYGAAAILAVMDGLQVQWLHAPDEIELSANTQFAIDAIVSHTIGVPWSAKN